MPILGQEVSEPMELFLVLVIVFITLASMVLIQKWVGDPE